MNAGLSVRLFWQVGEADRFQNLSLLGGAEVLEILRQDIAGRPPIVTDDQLLSALEQDVAETSAGS
jgi:hypothetical protein